MMARRLAALLTGALLALVGCAPSAAIIVPTARPTLTPTPTVTPSLTPDFDTALLNSPTPAPPRPDREGPTPTPLFGPSATPSGATGTPRPLDPNAPRIEFFTTNVLAAVPGEPVTLFWSTRRTTNAVIYQMERGLRSRLWNVGPDGSLEVPTRARDRGTLEFVLSVGDGAQRIEQTLSIPLACPEVWFFQPPAEACPDRAAAETRLIEQPFERGRLIYVAALNSLYALFNDGTSPAWIAFPNRYDPAVHPEFEPSFNPPAGFYQPVRVLGFLWRGNDTARSRLGLAIQPEFSFDGFVQSATDERGAATLYISSADGAVLQLAPEGAAWGIISPR